MLGHEQHYKGYRHFVMLGEARKLAMYLCQELSGAKLTEIADYFNLHHGGSVSFINHQVRKMKKENIGFKLNVECLIKRLLKQET
jgi:putative transposase